MCICLLALLAGNGLVIQRSQVRVVAGHHCASVTKQYNLVPDKGVISLARKVTAVLVESNGSLPPGLCGLTAKKPGLALCPKLVIECETTLLF